MDVDNSTFKSSQKFSLQNSHKPRQSNKLYFGFTEGFYIGMLSFLIELGTEFTRGYEMRRNTELVGSLEDPRILYVTQDQGQFGRQMARATGLGYSHEV